MSGFLGKLSPAKRVVAGNNNDLPLFYSNSMERCPRDTPRVTATLGELLMNVEDARNDQRIKKSFSLCGNSSSNDSALNTKILLNGISGEAHEGEMMAVLGASGSGKSTLIDALANRIAKDSLRGSITLNGEVLESRLQKVISAYVMQDDLLFPMLTVEETLMFSAEFRLPRSLSKKKKKARVQSLIDQLGLRSAARTMIGDEGHRGVSGGERRRVSIGIDIIHDPIILFLDEPTSGLDSTKSQSGSIVIMSIHQPSYRIMGLLDRLIFLSRGNTVFSGSPTHLPQFFFEFDHPIPENENKTEFALDLIRELENSPEGTKKLVEYHKEWRVKQQAAARYYNNGITLKEAITASISKGKLVSGAATTNSPSSFQTYANPFWIEMIVIGKRSILNSMRQPELIGMRIGAVMVTGIILATMFTKLDNSPKGVQERLGFFAFAMSTTFYTCAEAIPVFLQERYIFMRDRLQRLPQILLRPLAVHNLDPFAHLPRRVLRSHHFLRRRSRRRASGFLFFFLTILASFWAGSSFVTFLSGVVSNVMLGFTVVVAILAYFLLFSGFFISRDRILSTGSGVLQNEFEDTTKCFVRGIQIFDNSPLGQFPNAVKLSLLKSMSGVLGINVTAETCVTTGIDILKQQGLRRLVSGIACGSRLLGVLL
ncbi:hypothetical protein Bca52824_044987 [Brassica carinata]|uniref:ABC transporter domain-containing protein n=1 Tax=Brassica carinata TaxID=52824 RepID=A0A8X7R9U9_BRACI|nr:hypothetical protein Bca52824_044987 [Brassica carinata]